MKTSLAICLLMLGVSSIPTTKTQNGAAAVVNRPVVPLASKVPVRKINEPIVLKNKNQAHTSQLASILRSASRLLAKQDPSESADPTESICAFGDMATGDGGESACSALAPLCKEEHNACVHDTSYKCQYPKLKAMVKAKILTALADCTGETCSPECKQALVELEGTITAIQNSMQDAGEQTTTDMSEQQSSNKGELPLFLRVRAVKGTYHKGDNPQIEELVCFLEIASETQLDQVGPEWTEKYNATTCNITDADTAAATAEASEELHKVMQQESNKPQKPESTGQEPQQQEPQQQEKKGAKANKQKSSKEGHSETSVGDETVQEPGASNTTISSTTHTETVSVTPASLAKAPVFEQGTATKVTKKDEPAAGETEQEKKQEAKKQEEKKQEQERAQESEKKAEQEKAQTEEKIKQQETTQQQEKAAQTETQEKIATQEAKQEEAKKQEQAAQEKKQQQEKSQEQEKKQEGEKHTQQQEAQHQQEENMQKAKKQQQEHAGKASEQEAVDKQQTSQQQETEEKIKELKHRNSASSFTPYGSLVALYLTYMLLH